MNEWLQFDDLPLKYSSSAVLKQYCCGGLVLHDCSCDEQNIQGGV